jgi:hypothetical protein
VTGRAISTGILAGAAMFAALPVAAQVAKPDSVTEAARDGVFGFCPLFLAGQFALKDNAQLTMRGYSATPVAGVSSKWGATETVSASFTDGDVQFGGAPGKVCSVTITGTARAAAAKAVRGDLSPFAQFDMKADPANSSTRPGVAIEAFAGRIDATTVLHLFITTMDAPNPPATAIALYASDK